MTGCSDARRGESAGHQETKIVNRIPHGLLPGVAVAIVFALLVSSGASAVEPGHQPYPRFEQVWRHNAAGLGVGANGSEIVAYDQGTGRLYISGGLGIDVVDAASGSFLFGITAENDGDPASVRLTIADVDVSHSVVATAGTNEFIDPDG